MNSAAIFALIQKGIQLIPVLIQAGVDIAGTISSLNTLAEAGKNGTSISDADLATIEAQFDADLDAFNKPMA